MKKLGKTYIETTVTVPTKFLNGHQYTKKLRTWTAIPHEVIDARHMKRLHTLVELSSDGHVEILIEAADHYGSPRYHKLRGIVEFHVFVEPQVN